MLADYSPTFKSTLMGAFAGRTNILHSVFTFEVTDLGNSDAALVFTQNDKLCIFRIV